MIFGPVLSRRLGHSLGINLLPIDSKSCTLNCVYCECGWNPEGNYHSSLAKKNELVLQLEKRLAEIKNSGIPLDVITFAGNGEPTIHPHFFEIVCDVIELRNQYFPHIKIAVLTNSTTLGNPKVTMALKRIDLPILKIDSAVEATFWVINNPPSGFNFEDHLSGIKNFRHSGIIQTMFLRGIINNMIIDNTTPRELESLLALYREINPKKIMIYSLDRQPPTRQLEKIGSQELQKIAGQISKLSIPVQIA
jgi:wyosine [tRNA(Phe)-imidazoG37] synthetase (radical SAM superfamily)